MRAIIAARVATRWKTASELGVGETFENEKWRVHRYADSIVVTDLTNAGKRGKKVAVLALVGRGRTVPLESLAMEFVMLARRGDNLARMQQAFNEAKEVYDHDITIEFREERGIEVAPPNAQSLVIDGQNVRVEVKHRSFRIVNKNDTTVRAIEDGPRDVPVFYAWAKENEAYIKRWSFGELLSKMTAAGIRYHDFASD